MAFTSPEYLLLFLGSTALVYYCCPLHLRRYVLLAASMVYAIICTGVRYLALAAVAATVYLGGILLQRLADGFASAKSGLDKAQRKAAKASMQRKKRAVVAACLLVSFGLLFLFKYVGFFAQLLNGVLSTLKVGARLPVFQLLLPLGISYYTLQATAYLIDVYRGKYPACRSFITLLLFLSFFPQLAEGPINRFDTLAPQLQAPKPYRQGTVSRAALLIFWGLFKKLVIADRLALLTNSIFSDYRNSSSLVMVAGMLFYTLQLYGDFSGCIDIARGSAELFGIQLDANFRQPFFSASIAEFWRRWHITLGAWLRDYIFYPVSFSPAVKKLSRWARAHCSKTLTALLPTAAALLAVWLCNGLWHGAGTKYLLYGLYYYLLTLLGMVFAPLCKRFYAVTGLRKDSRVCRVFSILRTFLLVNFGMLLFRAESIPAFFTMVKIMFTRTAPLPQAADDLLCRGVGHIDLIAVGVGCLILFVVELLQYRGKDLRAELANKPQALRWAICYALIFSVVIFGAYGAGYGAVDPIYGQF